MILSCPECQTRFAVPDDKLRPDGRKVKCGKCAHVWFQAPPPPPEPEAEDEDDLYAQDPIAVTPLEPEEQSFYRPRNLPALREAEQKRTAGVAWIVVAVLAVAIVATAWFGREPIVHAWPAAEHAYQAVGLRVFPDPGEGLEIDFEPRRGEGSLMLRGEVENISDEDRVVPTLHLVVTDGGHKTLYTRPFEVDNARLGPGEAVPFSAEISPVPEGAANVSVLFTKPEDNP